MTIDIFLKGLECYFYVVATFASILCVYMVYKVIQSIRFQRVQRKENLETIQKLKTHSPELVNLTQSVVQKLSIQPINITYARNSIILHFPISSGMLEITLDNSQTVHYNITAKTKITRINYLLEMLYRLPR